MFCEIDVSGTATVDFKDEQEGLGSSMSIISNRKSVFDGSTNSMLCFSFPRAPSSPVGHQNLVFG
jgi:hypothetical protein